MYVYNVCSVIMRSPGKKGMMACTCGQIFRDPERLTYPLRDTNARCQATEGLD
jgi:hypothetical protein